MRGNFGLFCSFSPKLPRIHVGLLCKMEMRKINRERGYSGEKIQTQVALRTSFDFMTTLILFSLNLNLQLTIQSVHLRYWRLQICFSSCRHQRYTVVVNALHHLYMAFTPSKSQHKIIPFHLNQLKINPHHIRVLRISNLSMRIFIKNIHYLAFWRGGRTSQTRNWFSTNQHPHWKVSTLHKHNFSYLPGAIAKNWNWIACMTEPTFSRNTFQCVFVFNIWKNERT